SERVRAVAESEDRHLFALEQLLDVKGLAERLRRAEPRVHLRLRVTDPDALARGEAVGLHDTGRPGDGERARGRHSGLVEDVLGERLRSLDPRGLCARAEDGDAAVAELVGE